MTHQPVLLHEVVDGLDIHDGDILVDTTVGSGGHSEAILQSGKGVRIIALDLDQDALARSRARLTRFSQRVDYVNESFRNLGDVLKGLGVEQVNKILFDFGISSEEIDESGRGFTFQKDEPLLMTLRRDVTNETLTARDVVNDWSEESLVDIIRGFGEERFAGRIARHIVEARMEHAIETTAQLRDIIVDAVPSFYRSGRIHPATRTFQAIRIAVNGELDAIREGLKQGFRHLTPHGRIAAISFHSLEDRIVKQYSRTLANEGIAEILTKKPIVPTESEVKENPRSRSAKLRLIQKI